eukprot:Phypoly_transcript_05235.p1 GENE.Phypoly_transcript_05235~~Phypoly_transcript_05235.p1  ORF type:complete len:652 (+),score=46.52 Phypoly_transcript_05235:84-1958(+)
MEEFDVAKNGRYINDSVLERIFCCGNLQRLSLRKVCGVSSLCLQRLISHTPLLKKIYLTAIPYLSDDLLAAIGSACVHLEDLCIVRSDSISSIGLQRFAEACSGKLLKVSLFGCSNLNDEGLIPFFAANPHLLSVNVSRLQINKAIESLLAVNATLNELIIAKCRNVQDSSLAKLSQPPLCETITSLDFSTLKLSALTLSTIFSSCTNLQTLYIPYCANTTDDVILKLGNSLRKLYVARNAQLSDGAIAQIVTSNPDLEVLNATSCSRIGGQLLEALAGDCRFTLTTVYLARCNISKESLKKLVANCPELTCLDVCGCTNAVDDEFLVTLSQTCKKLQILDVSDCYDVTLAGIEEIAKSLAELDSLSMASTFTSDLHTKVLAEGVCRKLTTLNISGCCLLTPDFLPYFIKKQRSVAKLYASTNINQAFAARNPQALIEKMRVDYSGHNTISSSSTSSPLSEPTHQCLEALFLSDWPALSIEHLLPVLPYCLNLETLILSRCRNFDDRALEIIANSCKSLVYLDIAQCENVSNEGVISIATHCHLLQNLLANLCSKVRDPALEALIAHCPNLVELTLPHTRVSNLSAENVTKLQNLSKLSVKGTLVTRALAFTLSQQHPNLTIIL